MKLFLDMDFMNNICMYMCIVMLSYYNIFFCLKFYYLGICIGV